MVPLLVPIAALGILFGYLAVEAGLSSVAAIAMSATTFAGGAQFAAVGVLREGGGVTVAVAAGALLNVRYLILGLALAPWVGGGTLRRLVVSQFAVDESWAVAHGPGGQLDVRRLIGAGAALWIVHVGATTAGTVTGALAADPRAFGLDAALPALFLVLLRPHLTTRTGAHAAAVAGIVALIGVPLLPAGLPILAGAAAGVATVVARRE